MSQRGETAFVAMRVGRLHDPREVLGLARELKCRPIAALGYVMLWEEFILEVGDALTGRVRGYTADHIAAKLTFTGRPATLIRAMENAGILAIQRKTFFHPYWLETVTGHYALQRAERRDYEREKKRRQREERDRLAALAAAGGGGGADSGETLSPGTTPGHNGDSRGDRVGNPDIKKERKGVPGPETPPGPPQSGGGLGQERWEWVKEKHQRPTNPRACMPYLTAMTAEEWAVFQWVVTTLGRPGGPSGPSLSLKKRVLRQDSHKMLSTQSFLQFLPEWREKQLPREVTSLVQEMEVSDRERKRSARDFILAQMADPDVSDEQKARARALWLAAHPGETLEVPN